MNDHGSVRTSAPPERPLRRRLAAVMFADMVGYSRQIEQDETRNSVQAERSVQLFRSLVGDYGGQVANVAGDGILAIFDSAEEAVRFAVQVQSDFRDQAVWGDGQPIQFRIGINVGEVAANQDNIHGHCVNVAARLQQIAEPGTIVISSAVHEAVRERSGISVRSLGRPALKNIQDSIEVFAIGSAAAEPPLMAPQPRPVPPAPVARQPSIAVLALQNLSGDAANDHLCEGFVEDVIANLTRFRNLMVIARHSAFMFSLRSNSVGEIGERLGVGYLLAGSLRRSAKRIRIAVELIDVETESALWSDHFNIDMEELFDLQDEIAGSVASRLAAQIDFAERRQEAYHPRDMLAYGLVLRGQQLVGLYTKEGNAHARRLFEEAATIAPEYGRVYSSLSRTHNLDWRYSWSQSPEQSLDSAVALAQRAVELDPLDARGFSELGFAHLYKKRHERALAEYSRALALNPNDADIIAEYADALVYAGQPTKSIELLEQAMRLNPYYPDWYLWYLADAYITMRRHSDVIATVQRMQNPDEGRRMLAASFAHLGMMDEARAEAEAVLRLHPNFTIGRWRQRPPYRDPEVLEHFVEGMRMAGLPD
jgi:TolB-like protein/class 3 adenylate cyclase